MKLVTVAAAAALVSADASKALTDAAKTVGSALDKTAAGAAVAIAVSALGNDDTMKAIKFETLEAYFKDTTMVSTCEGEKKCPSIAGIPTRCA